MQPLPKNKFYVYILRDPEGSVFYVGKGKGKRVRTHRTEAKRGHKCYKCYKIRKIWEQGLDYTYEIVFTTDDENEAYAYEKSLIAQYGRETLTNLDAGGMGSTSHVKTDEAREKTRAKAKAQWADPERRQKLVEGIRTASQDETLKSQRTARLQEWVSDPEKIAERERRRIAKRNPNDSETRERMIAAGHKYRTENPNWRENLRQKNLGKKYGPETRAKVSAASKALWARRRAESRSGQIPLWPDNE